VDSGSDEARELAVQHAAERLRHADSVHRPCEPVSDLIGDDLAAAYAVQRLVTELQVIGGAQVWGRKMLDLTESHDGPAAAAGTLVDAMVVRDDELVTGRDLVQPRVATRLTVRLVRDLGAGAGAQAVREAIGAVGAALEIADLRVVADRATAVDVVADNAGAGLVVLGPERSPRDTPGPWRARVLLDGHSLVPSSETAWDGTIERLAALASAVAQHGSPLRAGEVVLLDAFGTATPLAGDGRYAAEVDGEVIASIRLGAPRPTPSEEAS
jgi:2-keto-4-pentenoate hydratase